jgi:hypothetical protein
MSLIPEACVEFNDGRKICVAIEKGKRYELRNNSDFKIRKVKIDKCIAQDEGEKRCDYLFDLGDLKRVYFIELKGGKLNTAVKQICSTVLYLKAEFRNYRMEARIIGSKDVPKFKNNFHYRKLASEIVPGGGTIERGTNNIYIESI